MINSLFVPETALQGTKIPSHVLWNDEIDLEITIKWPSSIELKEIYNVSSEGFNFKDKRKIIIKSFEINGYLGLLFISKKLNTFRRESKIQFYIKNKRTKDINEIEKRIVLFRPNLKVLYVPKEIRVNYNKRTKTIKLSEKIGIQNIGDGTSIVNIKPNLESKLELVTPIKFEEFMKNFLEELKDKFEITKIAFPEYAFLLDEFVDIIETPPNLNEEGRERIAFVVEELGNAFINDEEFDETFTSNVAIAYLKNVHLITELESFLTFINQIGEQKVFIQNAMDMFEFEGEKEKLSFDIESTDLVYNDYPIINISPINIICNEPCTVPIYELFDWQYETKIEGEENARNRRSSLTHKRSKRSKKRN